MNVYFLERGAQSIIASLWPVSDDIPKLIFPQFYEQWLSTQFIAKASKAQALRSAKLQLISNGLEPWDWAAFHIYGAR
jgi:CHAT domain-containing protein